MEFLETIKGWISKITQIILVLVPLAIVLQILFGTELIFVFSDVVANLLALIKQFGDSGLIGLIAIAIVLWVFSQINDSASRRP